MIGWAKNPSDPNLPVTVKFYLDATKESGGLFLGEVETNQSLAEANNYFNQTGNFGFTIPSFDYLKTQTVRRLYAYADISGEETLLDNSPKNFNCGENKGGISGDATISKNVNGSPLEIKTTARAAGAVEYLTYHGVEYVNIYDKGRQLQYA